jgi:hypothetical protein
MHVWMDGWMDCSGEPLGGGGALILEVQPLQRNEPPEAPGECHDSAGADLVGPAAAGIEAEGA